MRKKNQLDANQSEQYREPPRKPVLRRLEGSEQLRMFNHEPPERTGHRARQIDATNYSSTLLHRRKKFDSSFDTVTKMINSVIPGNGAVSSNDGSKHCISFCRDSHDDAHAFPVLVIERRWIAVVVAFDQLVDRRDDPRLTRPLEPLPLSSHRLRTPAPQALRLGQVPTTLHQAIPRLRAQLAFGDPCSGG